MSKALSDFAALAAEKQFHNMECVLFDEDTGTFKSIDTPIPYVVVETRTGEFYSDHRGVKGVPKMVMVLNPSQSMLSVAKNNKVKAKVHDKGKRST